jgi:2-polyprenyl-6-methoxyphenol hydroxylase-like FAD-dependent oxidoreductase
MAGPARLQVEVLEGAPDFAEPGAGLALWPNALRALDALEVASLPWPGSSGGTGRYRGRRRALALSRRHRELERRYGLAAMIHRADLLAVLQAACLGSQVGRARCESATVVRVAEDSTLLPLFLPPTPDKGA